MLWTLVTPANLVILSVTLLVIWFINTLFQRRRLPPGPFPLPIIGNLFQVRRYSDRVVFFEEMFKNYGKMFYWKVGQIGVVNICDQKLVHEAFVKKASVFSHRPTHLLAGNREVSNHFGSGLANNSGPQWKELRRISLTAMRDFGVGKSSLEEKIVDEINIIMEYIGKREGQPHCYKPLMVKATSNIICNIVFGDRFDYDDPKFNHLLEKVNSLFGNSSNALTSNINFIPSCIPIVKLLMFSREAFKSLKTTMDYIKELSVEHEKSFDPGNIRDFVDLMINFKKNDNARNFTERNMQRVIVDLFIAGSDTTANSLYWGLLYMAAYPQVQKKCQEEIDKVVGKGRHVTLSDKANLRYVEATILETLRMGIIAPQSVPHCTTEDVELAGYFIPKDTIVTASIAVMCRDPAIWPEPEKFDPTRFLDKENNLVNKDLLMNFSVGPRSCVGELLARMEMSLIFPSILQHFNIRPVSEKQPVDLKLFQGLTTQGKAQDLVMTRR